MNDIQLSPAQKIRFVASFALFSFLWMCGLMIVASVLLPQRLTVIGVQNQEAVFGMINTLTAIFSLLSNVIAGNLSDHTRSRLGKRTPWVVGGGLIGGVSLLLIGFLPQAWMITLTYCVSMIGLNMMIAPVIATLSDRVPYGWRATMSAAIAAGTLIGQSLGQILGANFLNNMPPGFEVAGAFMGIAGIATVLVWPKEPSSLPRYTSTKGEQGMQIEPVKKVTFKNMLISFLPPRNAPDFYKAFIGRSLFILSYYMLDNYQLYILQRHVGVSNKVAAATIASMAVVTMICSGLATLASGPLSDRIGRRKVPVVVASTIAAIGYLLPWLYPTTTGMILFAAVAGFGYGTYSSVDQALNVDVLPNQEQAGKDLGILNIATTLGQAIGPIITSTIVTITHSYNLAFPVAIGFAVFACVFILSIKGVK